MPCYSTAAYDYEKKGERGEFATIHSPFSELGRFDIQPFQLS